MIQNVYELKQIVFHLFLTDVNFQKKDDACEAQLKTMISIVPVIQRKVPKHKEKDQQFYLAARDNCSAKRIINQVQTSATFGKKFQG